MSYRKFQADQLFTGHDLLDSNHVLIIDDHDKVENIVMAQDAGDNIRKLPGTITPGLINCHCHLELSHLKNVIPPGTGLIEFLCSVVTKRNFDPEVIQREIIKAEQEMYENGIVAVADIGNTAETAGTKSGSNIRWQNFVEVISFTDEKAEENIANYKQVAEKFESTSSSRRPDRTSLVPHAPYSISPKTFERLNELTRNQVISFHNQEHPAEDELYKTGGGDFLKLFKIFGVNQSPFPVSGKTSIRSCLPYFKNGQTIFLVHNTYMDEDDIKWANDYASQNNLQLVYCLCPNANLYIENRLPRIELFIKHKCHLVLGTDSYSSNWQLSIAKEMQVISAMSGSASLVDILGWATLNAAKALRWDDELGSFDHGKKPGVTLLDPYTWNSRKLI
jgi:cytosine/adenosine deaminase-related metal-dependent hydrolase